MCGIAGILGRLSPPTHDAVRRMAAAMAHRGPDGEGVWASPPDDRGFGCILAHRRLAIISLSSSAGQPMVDPLTGDGVVFNGEIYNYAALRDELTADGRAFVGASDTEALLRVMLSHGEAGIPRLRGMFAFALWEERSRTLRLARDPLGIKPLYILRNPDPSGEWSVAFASEVRALLASGLIPSPRLDPVALAAIVWNGFVVGPHTAVRGIELLPAGETVVFETIGGAARQRRFWSMPSPGSDPVAVPGDGHDPGAELADSVRSHLISDVPLGLFLSGGVDSAVVANLAQRLTHRPLRTFTLAFEDERFNEPGHAGADARAIGTQHTECLLTEQAFINDLDRAIDVLDQPSFDGINSYFISRAVRDAGLSVALVGTGGDELFGGYASFRALPRLHDWARRTARIPAGIKVGAARAVRSLRAPTRGPMPPQTRWAKLPDMVGAGDDLVRLYQLAYALFLPGFQAELIEDPTAGGRVRDGLPMEFHERLGREIRGHSTLRAVSVLEQRCFLGERLLRDTDSASMAVSVEVRTPFVDAPLVRSLAGVPDSVRYRPVGRKDMLRRLGHVGLDPALFDRPKSGFVMPFGVWIRRSLGTVMNDTMRDHRLLSAVGLNPGAVGRLWQGFQDGMPGLYWSRVWAVYVFVRWCHRHGVVL